MLVMCRPSVLLLLILTLVPLPLSATDYQARSAELERLREQIREVQAGLGQERQRQDRLTRELRQLDEQVAQARRRLRELQREEAALARRIQELQGEHRQLSAQLKGHREYLSRQLLGAYVSGRQEYLRLLLNQEDPSRIDRLLVYYDYLNEARGERIRIASERIQRLYAIERELARKRTALEQSQHQQELAQQRLESSRSERARLLARVEADIARRDQQLARLRADESQLQELLTGLQQVLADIPDRELRRYSFRQSKGRLSWPLDGQLGARFGGSRGIGDSRWNGILIEPVGSNEVRAVSHGRVVFADWLRGFGLMVIIDHGEGFMTLYGHNESLYHEAGAWVQPGEVIATVGASGGRQRPGLYFEIRSGGKPIDPLPWLQSRSS